MDTSTSGAASRLLARKEQILEHWVDEVRKAIPAAKGQPQPILINSLPRLLHYLAEALSPRHPTTHLTEGTTIAAEHGGERVRVTGFRLEDVVREYHLLREVLLRDLNTPEVLTGWEHDTIVKSLDETTCQACTAYALVAEGLREKFMLTLAHDLRGPLTAARAGAQMILRKPGSSEVPRWAARAVEGIDRVEGMIRDLLDVGRVGSGRRLALEIASCELVGLVRGVIDNLVLTHGDRFVLVAPDGEIQGFWGAEALRRALENLASNALKYGSKGRPITLTVRQDHGRAHLSVHNEGSYIPIEEQGTLFQVFGRSQGAELSSTRGWGLGLALVRAVAEAHGGSIEVRSTPELGTTFVIDVPLDARPYQERPTTP